MPNSTSAIAFAHKSKFNAGLRLDKYSALIRRFMELMAEEIVRNSYGFRIGKAGTITVVKRKRTFSGKISLDYKATKERKKEIIENGGTPFEVIKDKNGKVVGDNGGIDYRVFMTNKSFFMWFIGHERKVTINGSVYWFSPVRYAARLIGKIKNE